MYALVTFSRDGGFRGASVSPSSLAELGRAPGAVSMRRPVFSHHPFSKSLSAKRSRTPGSSVWVSRALRGVWALVGDLFTVPFLAVLNLDRGEHIRSESRAK